MKSVGVLSATCLLLVSMSAQAAASPARSTGAFRFTQVSALRPSGWLNLLPSVGKGIAPRQTTATPSPTPTTTPTYPDPVVLLQNTAQVYTAIRTAHVELVTIAEKPSVQKLTIDGIGDATCKGPAMKMTVTADNLLEGTSQDQKQKKSFIQIKNKTWSKVLPAVFARLSASKAAKWKTVKNPDNVTFFGFPFPIGNPLFCTSTAGGSTGGSSGSPTDVFKDATTVGPDTFNGIPVWHVQETDVRTLSEGSTVSFLLDFLIGQDHFIPYALTQTFDDTVDGITLVQKQFTTKIGEKVKVTAPKT